MRRDYAEQMRQLHEALGHLPNPAATIPTDTQQPPAMAVDMRATRPRSESPDGGDLFGDLEQAVEAGTDTEVAARVRALVGDERAVRRRVSFESGA